MHEIRQQVRTAQRRMAIERFLSLCCWTLTIGLAIAVFAIAVPKIWHIRVEPWAWSWAWLLGSSLVALFTAATVMWLRPMDELDAALEIDRRCELKERVSSCLTLDDSTRESVVGSALIADAERQLGRVDVAEQFPIRSRNRAWWPLVPATIAFLLLWLVPNATIDSSKNANASASKPKTNVSKPADELRKKLAERKKLATEQGLNEAGELFTKLEKGMDNLPKASSQGRQKVTVQLNRLSDDIARRKQEMGDRDALRKQLEKIRDLPSGPADKLTRAMQKGDMKQALQQLKSLQDQITNGSLSKEQQRQLSDQISKISDQLKKMAEAHQQAQQELQKQIEQAKAAGDLKQANKLQEKLSQLMQQQEQMDRMNRLASQMGKCSDCLKKGDSKGAQSQMQQMASDLQGMQDELAEMDLLDQMLEDIQSCKNCMQCSQCQGKGCQTCMGNEPGNGMGEGQGAGARPEKKTDTNQYQSRLSSKIGRGKAVITGTAGGSNQVGDVRLEIQEAMQSATKEDADPLTDQKLPKAVRDHARQYFDSLRADQ